MGRSWRPSGRNCVRLAPRPLHRSAVARRSRSGPFLDSVVQQVRQLNLFDLAQARLQPWTKTNTSVSLTAVSKPLRNLMSSPPLRELLPQTFQSDSRGSPEVVQKERAWLSWSTLYPAVWRFPRCLVTCVLCITCGCFTLRDVMPGREFPITHMAGEDCKADKAQACYEEGLALTAGGSSAADRTRGIALMRQACIASKRQTSPRA